MINNEKTMHFTFNPTFEKKNYITNRIFSLLELSIIIIFALFCYCLGKTLPAKNISSKTNIETPVKEAPFFQQSKDTVSTIQKQLNDVFIPHYNALHPKVEFSDKNLNIQITYAAQDTMCEISFPNFYANGIGNSPEQACNKASYELHRDLVLKEQAYYQDNPHILIKH
jgi:hypothetical protein